MSGTARGAAKKLEAGEPFPIAMVNVCDASHGSCPVKASWLLSSPDSPWVLVLSPLPSRFEDSGHSVLAFIEGRGTEGRDPVLSWRVLTPCLSPQPHQWEAHASEIN